MGLGVWSFVVVGFVLGVLEGRHLFYCSGAHAFVHQRHVALTGGGGGGGGGSGGSGGGGREA